MTGRVVDGTAYVSTVTGIGDAAVLSTYLMPLVDVDDIDLAPFWEVPSADD